VQDKADRRSDRTRQALNQALIELMLEKSYASISVQDIVERANVGRSTFYGHYQHKDDLLSSQLRRLVEELSQSVKAENQKDHPLLPSLQLFYHVQAYYSLYKAVVMWGPGLEFVLKTFQVFLSKGIESQLEALLAGAEQQKSALPVAVVANYVAGAFLTLLKWWLDNGMVYSPEYMDELFLQLVMPGVQATLGVRL
jgi:AcrR family transcriptional regulator